MPNPFAEPADGKLGKVRGMEGCPAQTSVEGSPGTAVHVVPRLPTGLSPIQGSGTVAALALAVQQLAAACLVTDYHTDLYMRDRSGIALPTGSCLAYLLAAGFQRRWQLDKEVPSVAQALQSLIAVPEHFRLEWRAHAACIARAEQVPSAGSSPSASSPPPEGPRGVHTAAEEGPSGQQNASAPPPPPILLNGNMATFPYAQVLWAGTIPYQPGLRMFVGSRAAAEAVAGSMPETLVPTALSKKMHFFDALDCSLSDDCTNLSVQVLLPGDHGLPLASSWAVLADVLSVHNATVGLPTPLSRFTATALGGGIFSQLQAALGIDSGISSFPAGDSPNTGAGDPDQRNPVLAISDCRETEKSYDVTIRIDCGTDPSGVELTPALSRSGMSTHRYHVKIKKPRAAELDLQLLNAVTGSAHAKLLKKRRELQLSLPKSWEWPADVATKSMIAKQCADDLPTWTENDALGYHMNFQFDFNYITKVKPMASGGYTPPKASVADEVRESVKALFVRTMEGKVVGHGIVLRGHENEEAAFTIRAHLPIRKARDGRPVLPLTVFDHRLGLQQMLSGELSLKDAYRRFNGIMLAGVVRPNPECHLVLLDSDEELDMFSRILRKLSLRTEATKWQKANVPLGDRSPWFAVNLVPLYADKVLPTSFGSGASFASGCATTPKPPFGPGALSSFEAAFKSTSGMWNQSMPGLSGDAAAADVAAKVLPSAAAKAGCEGGEGHVKALLEEMCNVGGFGGDLSKLAAYACRPGSGILPAAHEAICRMIAEVWQYVPEWGPAKGNNSYQYPAATPAAVHCICHATGTGSVEGKHTETEWAGKKASSQNLKPGQTVSCSTATSSATSQRPGRIGGSADAGAPRVNAHNACAQCGTSPGKLVCTRCRGARYCSATCQKQHWKTHKPQCIPLTRKE
eukprot:jgi/Botrbrau1/6630/Bobra.104_2s0017.1